MPAPRRPTVCSAEKCVCGRFWPFPVRDRRGRGRLRAGGTSARDRRTDEATAPADGGAEGAARRGQGRARFLPSRPGRRKAVTGARVASGVSALRRRRPRRSAAQTPARRRLRAPAPSAPRASDRETHTVPGPGTPRAAAAPPGPGRSAGASPSRGHREPRRRRPPRRSAYLAGVRDLLAGRRRARPKAPGAPGQAQRRRAAPAQQPAEGHCRRHLEG